MTNAPSALPHDVDALHALILAAREAHAVLLAERNTIAPERDEPAVRTAKLEHIVAEMRRAMYGRRSERIDDDQLAHLIQLLKASPKLFCDETRCPVLDPGRGRTKTGFMWALARDDRPRGGADPPAVAYTYAPGRGGEHAVKLLAGFSGVLQVDGYAVYNQLARPTQAGGAIMLAFCWSHLRRKFYEIYVGGNQPIATEALARIELLYETCKLNAVDPLAWMTDVLTKLVNLWPAARIDELMPWAWAAAKAESTQKAA